MRRKLGRLHLFASWDYELDELSTLPTGVLVFVERFVFGFTLSRPLANPYLCIYAGFGMAELYVDLDGSWEAAT